jgi:hypothetical protein
MTPRDHLDRLSAVSPKEFVPTRNRLVAELRKAGRGSEAQAVARLRKPSPALWAITRLAATDRRSVGAFVDAVDRLRRLQLSDPRAAADALRNQRSALDALTTGARDLLRRSGLAASPTVLRRISDTLLGAAVDRRAAEALRRGEVTEELPAPGFEAFSGARVGSARLRLVPPRPAAARSASGDADAAAHARVADAAARRLELEAEQTERQAAEHQRNLTRLETERAEAHARLKELEARLRAARRVAREATAVAARARRKARR